MRKLLLNLGFWTVSTCAAMAQVSVEVSFEEDQYLSGESVPVAVHVVNHSGQTLHLGEGTNWLTFSVESREGPVVPRVGQLDVTGAFALPSSKTATKRLDLSKGFDLAKPGRYEVTATVWIGDWGRSVSSRPAGVDVNNGVTLWQQEFGVPGPAGEVPEVRRYVLQQSTYRKRLTMYVRVTGAAERDGDIVFPLGPTVSFAKPEMLVDDRSRLHVLFQAGARAFAYRVVGPDGKLRLAETYDVTTSHPRLKLNQEGEPAVVGGLRRKPSPIPAEPPAQPAPSGSNP